MNTFLSVLVGWIVVLYLVNKFLARRQPKTVKILEPKWHDSNERTDTTDYEAATQWMDKEDDVTELEYYNAGSALRESRDFAAREMGQKF